MIKYQEYEGDKLIVQKDYKYELDKLVKVREQNNTFYIIEKHFYSDNMVTKKYFFNGKRLYEVIKDFKSDTLHYHEKFEWQKNKNIPIIKYVTKYEGEKKIQYQHYYDGTEISREEYRYNRNNLLVRDEFNYGKLQIKAFYDTYGNIISSIDFYWKSNSNYEYKYNAKGDWLRRDKYYNTKIENTTIREMEYWD